MCWESMSLSRPSETGYDEDWEKLWSCARPEPPVMVRTDAAPRKQLNINWSRWNEIIIAAAMQVLQ